MTHRTSLLSALLLLLIGCGGTTTRDLTRLKGEVATQRGQLNAAKSAADASEGILKAEGAKQPGVQMYIGIPGLLDAINQEMPHHFKGKALSKKHLKGKFQFMNPRNLKYHAGNRATWVWDFIGKEVKVSFKGVPMAGKKDEKKAKQALQAGGHVKMSANFWADSGKQVVYVKARCTGAKLKKHNTKRHQDAVCDGVNKKLFKKHRAIPLPGVFRGKQLHVTTTPNHLIISGR